MCKNKKEQDRLTFLSDCEAANCLANKAVTVLFPTPPFPDKITILFLTFARRFVTAFIASWLSCLPAPEAQNVLLGHPAHASFFPASSLAGPGQSKNFKIICY